MRLHRVLLMTIYSIYIVPIAILELKVERKVLCKRGSIGFSALRFRFDLWGSFWFVLSARVCVRV